MSPPGTSARRRHVDEVILLLLVFLGALGVAVNDYSRDAGYHYWLAMAPVFGIVSVAAGWARARRLGRPVAPMVRAQVLHWLGASGAVFLIYLLQSTGRMQNEAAGLAALITLALACFTAGVSSDWRLMVVGILLALIAAGLAWLEKAMWLVLLPTVAVAAVATWLVLRRRAEPEAAS
jgi:hypothetical protein